MVISWENCSVQIRPHSQRFRDFAVTVNFYCKYDVATSFRMEPIVLLLPAWPRWNQFINTKFTRPIIKISNPNYNTHPTAQVS